MLKIFPADFRRRRRKSAEIPAEWNINTSFNKINLRLFCGICEICGKLFFFKNFPQISDSYWDEKWKM